MITTILIIILLSLFNLQKNDGIQFSNKKAVSVLENYSLKDEMNKSVIDGFYNNDTCGIGNKIYLMK